MMHDGSPFMRHRHPSRRWRLASLISLEDAAIVVASLMHGFMVEDGWAGFGARSTAVTVSSLPPPGHRLSIALDALPGHS